MFEMKFNGKPFNSRDYKDALMKAQMDGIRSVINKKLAPFAKEIQSHNGIVNVNVNGSKSSIELDNMPNDLIEKIKNVLK